MMARLHDLKFRHFGLVANSTGLWRRKDTVLTGSPNSLYGFLVRLRVATGIRLRIICRTYRPPLNDVLTIPLQALGNIPESKPLDTGKVWRLYVRGRVSVLFEPPLFLATLPCVLASTRFACRYRSSCRTSSDSPSLTWRSSN